MMVTHAWILPWLGLFAGVVTLLTATVGAVRQPRPTGTSGADRKAVLAAGAIWLIMVGLGIWLELLLGTHEGVDYIGGRGYLLGSLGGLLVVLLAGRAGGTVERPTLPGLIVFGVSLTQIGIARLWLTHGEMTGLTAVALSTTVAVLVLGTQLHRPSAWVATAGAFLTATLALAMELGFTRATMITEAAWPDLPLLLAGAAAFGIIAGTMLTEKRRVVAAFLPPVFALAFCFAAARVLHEPTALKLSAAGVLGAVLLAALSRSAQTTASASHNDWETETATLSSSRSGHVEATLEPDALSLVVLLAAVAVGYAYWAGFGVAILVLALWSVYAGASIVSPGRGPALVMAAGFGLMICTHRALTLQNDTFLSGTPLTDVWNLVALGVGVLVPLASGPSSPGPVAVMRSVVTLVAVPLLIAYLLAGQAVDGLVIGAALSIAAAFGARRIEPALVAGAVLLGLLVLQAMPIIATWSEPTRQVKVELLGAVALSAIVLTLLPRRTQPAPAEIQAST
ncbi:MAG: hypothetical protein ACLQVD_05085 [Capsulimonadaceae bacterium]